MKNALARPAPMKRPGMSFPPTTRKIPGLIVSEIILETLQSLKISYPMPTEARRRELLAIREQLLKCAE